MANNKIHGDAGELDVCEKIPCPNCGKKLMLLPANYPLYDIQCEGCSFRAQIKTNHCKPKKEILGAGWQIMDKVLKSGFLMPALITNFVWDEKGIERQEIRFYPFVPKKNLQKYKLSETARRANYEMFRYTKLDELPSFLLYEK